MAKSILNIQEKAPRNKFRSLQISGMYIHCTKVTSATCLDEFFVRLDNCSAYISDTRGKNREQKVW